MPICPHCEKEVNGKNIGCEGIESIREIPLGIRNVLICIIARIVGRYYLLISSITWGREYN